MWKLLTILQAASRLFLNEIENNDGGGVWRKGAKKQRLLGNHFSLLKILPISTVI